MSPQNAYDITSLDLRNGIDVLLTRELAKSVAMGHFIILSFHHRDFHVFFKRSIRPLSSRFSWNLLNFSFTDDEFSTIFCTLLSSR